MGKKERKNAISSHTYLCVYICTRQNRESNDTFEKVFNFKIKKRKERKTRRNTRQRRTHTVDRLSSEIERDDRNVGWKMRRKGGNSVKVVERSRELSRPRHRQPRLTAASNLSISDETLLKRDVQKPVIIFTAHSITDHHVLTRQIFKFHS